MVTKDAASSVNSKMLFEQLTQRLKGKPEVSQRILAHIRAVTGHATLPAFVNNGSTEAEKVELLATCLRAVIRGDFTSLKGEVPKGQAPRAEAPPEDTPPVPATKVNSYKVGCKTREDKDWSYNGLRFFTADEAKQYGSDLHSRWMALDKWEVHESEDQAEHHFADGKVIYPKEEKPETSPPEPKLEEPKTETANTPPPAPSPVPERQPGMLVTPTGLDPKMAAAIAALQALVQPAPAQPEVSTHLEEHIKAIVAEAVLKERDRFQEYCKGFMEVAVPRLITDELVKAAKFELVRAIEEKHKTSLRDLAKAIAEVV